MRRIVKSKGLLHVYTTGGKFSEVEARERAGIVAEDLHEDVAGGVTQLSHFGSKPSRRLQISSSPMGQKLAPQGGKQGARPVQGQGELACPGVHLGQLRRAPAPVHN